MNLQKIKDHFPEYADMKIGEFFKYMHKTYYPEMKITDMYKALLKLTQIIKKEEVKEDPKVEVVEKEVKAEPEAKKDDTAINELKEKIDTLTQKIDTINEKITKETETEDEPVKEEKDLSNIIVKTKAAYNDKVITIEMTAQEALEDNKEAIDNIPKMLSCIDDMESLKDVLNEHEIPKEYRDKILKYSKELQKNQDKTTTEADRQAIKQLKKMYEKERLNIEKQIE